MSDGPNKLFLRRDLFAASSADTVVSRALSLVAARDKPGRGPRAEVDERFLFRLEAAVLDPERSARRDIVSEMRHAGIPWEDVADIYIPAVARRLGERWVGDTLSFAEVTIGTARLQAMLRELGPEWSEERIADPMAPNLVFVVLQNDDHTLGAMVAASQLGRRGVSVRLSIGESDRAIAELVAGHGFDAVLISASMSVDLESVRKLVKMLRTRVDRLPPVVLGGSILETDRDARAITGADHITSDPLEALKLCGLRVPHYAPGLSRTGI